MNIKVHWNSHRMIVMLINLAVPVKHCLWAVINLILIILYWMILIWYLNVWKGAAYRARIAPDVIHVYQFTVSDSQVIVFKLYLIIFCLPFYILYRLIVLTSMCVPQLDPFKKTLLPAFIWEKVCFWIGFFFKKKFNLI